VQAEQDDASGIDQQIEGQGLWHQLIEQHHPQKATVRTLPRPRMNFIPRPYRLLLCRDGPIERAVRATLTAMPRQAPAPLS
jgi:hypothetical protein